MIDKTAKQYDLDPALVEAIIAVESSGRANAYRYEPNFFKQYLAANPRYAATNPERTSASYGLMQILYSTAVQLGFAGDPEYLFVPSVNVQLGCAYLAKMFKRAEGDLRQAVARYNGGGNWQAPGPQLYADRVIDRMEAMRAQA
ncbi:MAG: transglycosylase SLT domain-containing protein [Bacteroidales bacterium]